MKCEDFRAAALEGVTSDEWLSHLRSCEACLSFAVERDPDLMFRSMGGEIEPPGGAAAFAAEVMQQIQVRGTERQVAHRESALPVLHRWSLAAAATVLVVSGALFWPRGDRVDVPGVIAPVGRQAAAFVQAAPVRPVVERWDSSSAMIIEIPQEETSDLKVVMVFDESLPADL